MLISILTMTESYPEIWEDFYTPDHVDRQLVIDAIVIDCAELELLYSDPNILKYIIRVWTEKNIEVWRNLQETLEYQYNPIWNVEGSETTERTLNGNTSIDNANTRTPNLNYKRSPDLVYERTPDLTIKRTPDLQTDESVAGYNSDDLANRNRRKESGSESSTETGHEFNTESGSETRTETGSETSTEKGKTDNYEHEKTVFTRGMNIGVMSTQALIKEQREIVDFTLTEFIKESFKCNFCLMVY